MKKKDDRGKAEKCFDERIIEEIEKCRIETEALKKILQAFKKRNSKEKK